MTNSEFSATVTLMGLTIVEGLAWNEVYYGSTFVKLYTPSRYKHPDHDLAFYTPLLADIIEKVSKL